MSIPDQLKIAICEDSQEDAARLQSLIQESGYPARVTRYKNGGEFLEAFARARYDLLFLDIYMEGMTGLEVAAAVRERNRRVVIAFTTASGDFTRESYRLNAYKYIIKPAAPEEVQDALELALLKRKRRQEHACTIVTRSGPVQIPLDDIRYAEVGKSASVIHLTQGSIETYLLFSDLEKLLPPPRFLRCHRAYIVNLEYVKGINEHGDFIMENGGSALVRIRDSRKMKAAYEDYIFARVQEDDE